MRHAPDTVGLPFQVQQQLLRIGIVPGQVHPCVLKALGSRRDPCNTLIGLIALLPRGRLAHSLHQLFHLSQFLVKAGAVNLRWLF